MKISGFIFIFNFQLISGIEKSNLLIFLICWDNRFFLFSIQVQKHPAGGPIKLINYQLGRVSFIFWPFFQPLLIKVRLWEESIHRRQQRWSRRKSAPESSLIRRCRKKSACWKRSSRRRRSKMKFWNRDSTISFLKNMYARILFIAVFLIFKQHERKQQKTMKKYIRRLVENRQSTRQVRF